MMKLQFNPNLAFQQQAIASVKDLFLGKRRSNPISLFRICAAGLVQDQNTDRWV